MSSEKNNGGPAFPTTEHKHTETGHYEVTQYGMTLRDYFAAKAMEGLIAKGSPQARVISEQIAEGAYRVADAMLKAREQ